MSIPYPTPPWEDDVSGEVAEVQAIATALWD